MKLILLIGLQGSGKSTFYRTNFAEGYEHISKDLLRNNKRQARRELQLQEEAFKAGRSVVIDNTNASREEREPLIRLGRLYGAEIVGYFFEVQVKKSLERNRQRSGKEKVPDVAIFATRKRLVPPAYEEGFDTLFSVKSDDDFKFVVSDWLEEGPLHSSGEKTS